ncbi:hypothetical protein BN2497_2647 [Janthinobacterium sp. CG23_2]|nr:hypothetical protein BN2497_2647 [Janthinobacterium sp. CG23_2]CUU27721.1 hypothetical protein BN3177_2647 [Janthinobacterium sp. CG23_2]
MRAIIHSCRIGYSIILAGDLGCDAGRSMAFYAHWRNKAQGGQTRSARAATLRKTLHAERLL